jgi:hypothetical protein
MAAPKLHYVSSVSLRRFNGIGTTLVGRINSADYAPWHFKQFAFTIFFVPVYLGRFYAVQRATKFTGWKVAGWLSDAELAAQVGPRAYWLFKLRLFILPILFFAPFIVVFVSGTWLGEHPGVR